MIDKPPSPSQDGIAAMPDYPYALKLKTARFVANLEDWLYRNCEGGFEIRIDDISEDLEIRRYLILFERREDLDGFKWALVRPGMPDRVTLPGRDNRGLTSSLSSEMSL